MKRVLALLLAAVMLLALPACGKKEDTPDSKPVPGDAATVAEQFMAAYFQRDLATQLSLYCYDARAAWEADAIKDNGSAEAFFTTAQKQAEAKGLDVHVDSFDSYFAAYHEVDKQYKREAYGEYTLTTKAISDEVMTQDRLPEFLGNVIGAVDAAYIDTDAVNAITEVHIITVNIVITGEKKELNEKYLVYVALCDGKWQVANHSV